MEKCGCLGERLFHGAWSAGFITRPINKMDPEKEKINRNKKKKKNISNVEKLGTFCNWKRDVNPYFFKQPQGVAKSSLLHILEKLTICNGLYQAKKNTGGKEIYSYTQIY